MLINTKLRINSLIIVLGLIVLGFATYNSFSSLSKEHDHSKSLSASMDNLKSMLIGGLLYNSASGVVKQNPNAAKAKKP